MLKKVNPLLSPDLLKILSEMGHGDEIVIADANFPSANYGQRLVRADGISGTAMLDAVLSVFPLDTYSEQNFVLMQLVPSDVGKVDPVIWKEYEKIVEANDPRGKACIGTIERMAYYEEAKKCYAIIATGESALYAKTFLMPFALTVSISLTGLGYI